MITVLYLSWLSDSFILFCYICLCLLWFVFFIHWLIIESHFRVLTAEISGTTVIFVEKRRNWEILRIDMIYYQVKYNLDLEGLFGSHQYYSFTCIVFVYECVLLICLLLVLQYLFMFCFPFTWPRFEMKCHPLCFLQ